MYIVISMRSILESHSVSVLKKEISKTNIKGYSKMKKAEVVNLMLKHKARFSHIKHAKGDAKTETPKPKKVLYKVKKEAPVKKEASKPKETKEEKKKRKKKQKKEVKSFLGDIASKGIADKVKATKNVAPPPKGGFLGAKLDRDYMSQQAHEDYDDGAGIYGWEGMYHHISDRDATYHEKHLANYGGGDPRMDRIEGRMMEKESRLKDKVVRKRIAEWFKRNKKTKFKSEKEAREHFAYN